MSEIIDELYKLRSNFVLIGLTGRTGCGCSTVASLLSQNEFEAFEAPIPNQECTSDSDRKYQITYNYINNNNWHKFTIIRASDIITFFVLQHDYNDFKNSLSNKLLVNQEFINTYNDYHKKAIKVKKFLEQKRFQVDLERLLALYKEEIDGFNLDISQYDSIKKMMNKEKEEAYTFLFQDLPTFTNEIKENLHHGMKKNSYEDYQIWGDNIRTYDKAIIDKDEITKSAKPSSLVKQINLIIKFLRAHSTGQNNGVTYVVIDALRNPYEILFFRERYSAFYVMSINTSENNRKDRLQRLGFDAENIKKLDNKEYPDKDNLSDRFVRQNIEKCIELSDIHIVNNDYLILKKQLVHYLSLMTHPGIIPPTPIERIMQIAYTAKLNSGCLSRQVGAAITDQNFSIKAIGWNNAPEGQISCILRNWDNLVNQNDSSAYSDYEFQDIEFRKTIEKVNKAFIEVKGNDYKSCLHGRNQSYCFKDLQNLKELKKNQVHTRSLHAEENAFLQISKYGGIGIKGGKLFTTASPCELCAKKAYQLGIEEIYYIDPYPGISLTHILHCGTKNPKLILFEGAIGRAYLQLYSPLLSHKDELSEILGVSMNELFKKEQEENNKSKGELSKKINKGGDQH